MKAVVLYYTRTGVTEKMAQTIASALQKEGISTDLYNVERFPLDALPSYDLIIIGSPTYYGTMAAEVKKFLDESVRFHGDLEGKVGGAFASSANPAGGNETTVLSILGALLIHGMIVKGMSEGSHYGPVAIENFDSRAEEECKAYARDLAKLVQSLHSTKGQR
ncbi:MAG: NAD(P)H-dependent oxidoreductase [Candidatus Caldatribacterium sp.]|uniref:flavodoxin family protein n=1 Tax=Candidatus Caldatribacterium sp. TaxID=2282143 RepID=UPI002998E633|nr:NAD(P)H-dependent oxidoreductase [Candidatus Caldatribacterium sp.]MCX7731161.1 NAD(P)H-dependent oxidoreductase [Candidatus Caldatribacterium sp.]MDW8081362.1 flavodoxin domain-containing protein [Candidatus Calescibacterium sp.]